VIDSHFHLADEAFEPDLEAVVGRALGAGVRQGLCILAAGDAVEGAERLAGLWPAVRFAAGVHPHQAGAFAGDPGRAVATVRAALAANDRVRAVGEIGLDYHYEFAPRSVQQDVFAHQVRLARELDLPVVIHTREATEDTVAIIRREGGAALRGVFHCFSGDADMAREALDHGVSLTVFAEGGRTLDGRVKPFQKGVFRIVRDLGFPIVPMSMVGSFEFNRKGSWMLHPSTIVVHLHDTIETKGLSREELEALPDRVYEIVAKPVHAALEGSGAKGIGEGPA